MLKNFFFHKQWNMLQKRQKSQFGTVLNGVSEVGACALSKCI